MKNKYYILASIFFVLNILIWVIFQISVEYNLSFLIPFVFSLFLSHPDIEEYKTNYRHSYSASRILFKLENLIKSKTSNSYLILYLPSFIFFVLFMLSQLNFLLLPVYFLGVMVFEVFKKLLHKI